jgi:KUP system potassium uptake protein
VTSSFYELVSGWIRWPIVAIATVATVVASQAVISGVFSLTRQAIQLEYCPRMTVVQTSGSTEGQIYMPEMNKALMIGCVAVVLAFKSSSRLAVAYGIAVTGTMVITTILYCAVARRRRLLQPALAVVLFVVFLAVDRAFFAANLGKLHLAPRDHRRRDLRLDDDVEARARGASKTVVVGDALVRRVFGELARAAHPSGAGHGRLHDVQSEWGHPGSPPSREAQPRAPRAHRAALRLDLERPPMCRRIAAQRSSRSARASWHVGRGVFPVDLLDVTYYFGHETALTTGPSTMAPWRKRLFVLMSRNAQSATAFFKIPPNRVVELGAQIEL